MIMKKRLSLSILAACLLLTMILPTAYATETTAPEETTEATEETVAPAFSTAASGTCGNGLTWELNGSTLTISGSGEMDAGSPWEYHKDKIKKVVFTGGVTKVGEEAFAEFDELTSVDFGSAMKEIDTRAFYACEGLTTIHLPATFRRFGVESFRECSNLTTVYCDGGMPSFNGNCLWNGNYITIYHPTNNPWPQEAVEQLVNNFGGRLEVLGANIEVLSTDEKTPAATEKAEQTKAAAEPATEPTTEPTTEPATVPTTQPTEAATEPATVPATVPEATETIPETTTPAQLPEQAGDFNWLWLILVPAGLAAVILIALIIRIVGGKDGRYTE